MLLTDTRPTHSTKINPTKFSDFLKTLSADEKSLLKSRISGQIPHFFNDQNQLAFSKTYTQAKFDQMAIALYNIAHSHRTIPYNGIAYRGKPEWVTDELLNNLQQEAIKRRHEPLDRVDHFLGCGGKFADELSTHPDVLSFVSAHAGAVEPTGIASYLYYDSPGLGIRPHVDTDVFSINLMLMLKHQPPANQIPSATLVFPAGEEMESYRLEVGEVMLMYGGSVVHARSIIGEEENIHLLTIGFNAKREALA